MRCLYVQVGHRNEVFICTTCKVSQTDVACTVTYGASHCLSRTSTSANAASLTQHKHMDSIKKPT